ncbi:MAG: ASKHA domain-containing protein [Coriobacteriia bacterium]
MSGHERVPVTFAPGGVTVWVERGSTIIAAARSAGVVVPAPCGGRGVCGTCGVRVVSGRPMPPDEIEKQGLASAPAGVRLACRARVDGPLEVFPLINRGASPSTAAGALTQGMSLVAAVDLGTTTVSAVLVDRATGRELGRATAPNRQQSWGSDVLSRLTAALDGAASELGLAAEESILEAMRAACDRAGACLPRVERLVVAGNTAMTALLARADTRSLAHAPFAIPAGHNVMTAQGSLAGELPDGCEITLIPAIASFVGGDVTAGLLASGLVGQEGTALLVDIGTNAEIALSGPAGLVVSSAAAGPAFEGFGISSGGPWADGAIERVEMRGADMEPVVAGGGEPRWLCGSGLVSTIALLRRLDHLTADGRMVPEGPLAARFARRSEIMAFDLGRNEDGPYLLQTDVRAFQTAKAAVAAAVITTVRSAHVKPKSLNRICLAGTFGGSLAVGDLIDLGVLPSDRRDAIEFVGDAALLGAAMIAFDPSLMESTAELTGGARHVELANNKDFTGLFVAHTALEPFKLARGLFG